MSPLGRGDLSALVEARVSPPAFLENPEEGAAAGCARAVQFSYENPGGLCPPGFGRPPELYLSKMKQGSQAPRMSIRGEHSSCTIGAVRRPIIMVEKTALPRFIRPARAARLAGV